MNEHRNYIDNNINNNMYEDKDYTLGRIAFGSFVYNPLTDSYIKNAYARNKGIAFYNAVNNGGFYSNYTFMGGNAIFGGEGSFLRKFPLINKLYKKTKFGEHSVLTNINKRTGFHYINPSKNNARYVTDGYISNSNDILESGFGFGKKYNFTDKDRFLYNNFVSNVKAKDISTEMTNNIKNELKNIYLGKGINNFSNDYIKQLDELEKLVNGKKIIKKDEISNTIYNFLKNKGIDNVEFGTKNSKEQILNIIRKERNIIDSGKNYKLYDLFKEHDAVKNVVDNINSIVGDSTELNRTQLKKLKKIFKKYDYKKISNFFKEGGKEFLYEKALFGVVDDKIIKDTIESTVNTISHVTTKSKLVNVFDTLLGNKVGMFVAGALGGPIGIAIQVALGVASAVSVVHQENSINNYIEDRMANYNDYDYIESNMGESSINSHYSINNSNYNDYIKISTNKNVSKNALREIDPIKVDSQLSDSKNFTIF